MRFGLRIHTYPQNSLVISQINDQMSYKLQPLGTDHYPILTQLQKVTIYLLGVNSVIEGIPMEDTAPSERSHCLRKLQALLLLTFPSSSMLFPCTSMAVLAIKQQPWHRCRRKKEKTHMKCFWSSAGTTKWGNAAVKRNKLIFFLY